MINELGRAQSRGKGVGEACALHKAGSVSLFIRLQDCFPAGLAHHDPLSDLLSIRQKLIEVHDRNRELMTAAEAGKAMGITESRLVNALNQIARLLELD